MNASGRMFPVSLRRHYPHQVNGSKLDDFLSARHTRTPPFFPSIISAFFLVKGKEPRFFSRFLFPLQGGWSIIGP